MHTGDAAVVHPDGYVEIRERLKDVIISGGENISSVEVESILLTHPAVQEVAVVGMPHEKWGEAPHAFVVLKNGARRNRRATERVFPNEHGPFQGSSTVHGTDRSAQNGYGQDSEICVALRSSRNCTTVKPQIPDAK